MFKINLALDETALKVLLGLPQSIVIQDVDFRPQQCTLNILVTGNQLCDYEIPIGGHVPSTVVYGETIAEIHNSVRSHINPRKNPTLQQD
jgi:hypothetical protein